MRAGASLTQLRALPGGGSLLGLSDTCVAYEAGPTGFGLYRELTAAGIRCVVAAPSKLQRPCGDRVKTDAKDAVHLARLLRLGELTAVGVPSVDQEAARDLVRAREDCRGDPMRARHRLAKLLLRQCGGDELARRRLYRHRQAARTVIVVRARPSQSALARAHRPRPGVASAHVGLPEVPDSRCCDESRCRRVER